MYHLVYGILYVFSLLPLRVLYLFSDLCYLILYHLVGYRRKVVAANLLQAFPEKSEEERKRIEKKFYRNFTDNFVEVLKLISASKEFVNRHFTGDYSVFNQIHAEGKRCQFLLSHHFNWEMASLAIPMHVRGLLLVAYMPVTNKVFDRLMIHIRTRTGAALVPATDMSRSMMKYRRETYILTLVADQNAGYVPTAHWITFFGKPVPFVTAPESGARRSNIPVVFGHFRKLGRGRYTSTYVLAESSPASLPVGELTIRYARFLESVIREQPETWLWSHRRWKWDWKEEYSPVLD